MDNNKNKCNKYEGYFIFKDDESLKKHLEECDECKKEHEKYIKVSSLLKEIAPIYLERENKRKMMTSAKRLACCFVVFVCLVSFTGYKMYDNYLYQSNNSEQESYISEMGLPTDKYGFLSL